MFLFKFLLELTEVKDEHVSRNCDAFRVFQGFHTESSFGRVVDQGEFSKVIARNEMSDELFLFGLLIKLSAFYFSFFNDIKIFANFVFSHNDFICLEVLNSNCIEKSDLFVSIEVV